MKAKQVLRKHTDKVSLTFWPFLVLLAFAYPMAERTQWFRDLTGITPFKDVAVEAARVENGEIWVRGAITIRPSKSSCTRGPIDVYTSLNGGPWVPAEFRTQEPLGTPQDRPPGTQSFGWWIIKSHIEAPDHAAMYVTHYCGQEKQTNRVFSIDWKDIP